MNLNLCKWLNMFFSNKIKLKYGAIASLIIFPLSYIIVLFNSYIYQKVLFHSFKERVEDYFNLYDFHELIFSQPFMPFFSVTIFLIQVIIGIIEFKNIPYSVKIKQSKNI